MTAMALDALQKRLITGSDNGVMKVWNFSSGACLKEMTSLCSKDITGASLLYHECAGLVFATDAARFYLHQQSNCKPA